MKLKPTDGCEVRDPVKGTLLPASGADVVVDSFWRRRLRDGDVVEVTDTATATTTTASSTASTKAAAATTTASTASADTTTSTEASS